MKIYISLLFVALNLGVYAQNDAPKNTQLIQLSGVVVTEEAIPLPYSTAYNRSLKKGVISDFYGFFTLVTQPGDTVFFSRDGFQTSPFIVSDTLKENRYSIIHMLVRDTLVLPEVVIHPWPTRSQFADYFVNMTPYEDDVRRAQKELSGESLAFVAARLESDASLASGNAFNMRNTRLYTNGQLPANNLLNPYSWSKLIQDWKEGKLTRQ
jgi:hypothetical protein